MYKPLQNLMEGYMNAFPLQLFPYDDYFPRMAEADYYSGYGKALCAKSFFVRSAPFHGSYAILSGVVAMIREIALLDFANPAVIEGLRDMDYSEEFILFMAQKRFLQLQVFSPLEGSLIFPNEPAVTFFGPLPDIRFVEGIATEALNFPTLATTKWHRLVRVVRPGGVMDFSRRRAQNHAKATIAAMLAGCSSTSNSEMRRFFDFLVTGTMGHEWIQRFGDPKEAFRAWLRIHPRKPFGLVDTKQCLAYDFPAWLEAVWEFRDAIKYADPRFWGWRNDSGDLSVLTIEQYVMFMKHPLAKDPWFRDRMRVILTNDLDEYTATAIIQQIRAEAGAAGFNAEDILCRIIWAAGTKPGTCDDQPSLGGVAKLMEADAAALIKLAFDADGMPGDKTSIPGFNLSAMIRGADDEIKCVLIYPARQYKISNGKLVNRQDGSKLETVVACHPDNPAKRIEVPAYTAVPQQKLIYDSLNNKHENAVTAEWDNPTIGSVVERIKGGVDQLHWTMTRLDKPAKMPVNLTPELFELRQRMIREGILKDGVTIPMTAAAV